MHTDSLAQSVDSTVSSCGCYATQITVNLLDNGEHEKKQKQQTSLLCKPPFLSVPTSVSNICLFSFDCNLHEKFHIFVAAFCFTLKQNDTNSHHPHNDFSEKTGSPAMMIDHPT